MTMFYDYSKSKAFCEEIGLQWLGDDYQGLIDSDKEARRLELSQYQVDSLMRLHLWQTKILLTPKNYSFGERIVIALYFLTGWKPK